MINRTSVRQYQASKRNKKTLGEHSMNRMTWVWLLGLLLLHASVVEADVELPSIISDHMVLLKSDDVPIWGKAESGERISVSLNGKTVETTAGKDGRWRVSLNLADSPDGPFEMIVRGNNTLTIRDVVVGEVWLGSGQSNMEPDDVQPESPTARDCHCRESDAKAVYHHQADVAGT